MDNILEDLQEIFRDVLDYPDLVLTPESNAESVEGWDSAAHIYIVTAVEQHYGVRFALGELQELKNIGDMIELIKLKLASK